MGVGTVLKELFKGHWELLQGSKEVNFKQIEMEERRNCVDLKRLGAAMRYYQK